MTVQRSAYAMKLTDPRWQKKRLEILSRDEWKCRFCGDKDTTLHVHHLRYKHGLEPWDTPNQHLITLCEVCHEAETEGRKGAEQLLLDVLADKAYDAGTLVELAAMFHYSCLSFLPQVVCSILAWHITNTARATALGDSYFEALEYRKVEHRTEAPCTT